MAASRKMNAAAKLGHLSGKKMSKMAMRGMAPIRKRVILLDRFQKLIKRSHGVATLLIGAFF
jgi:hypothetical protein